MTQSQEDEEPMDWDRFRKYDVFKDLLGAAAANPDAQVSSSWLVLLSSTLVPGLSLGIGDPVMTHLMTYASLFCVFLSVLFAMHCAAAGKRAERSTT